MPDPYIWFSDGLIPYDTPCLLPNDRGFLYGDGVFETMRLYGGRPFRFQNHLERLNRGLTRLRIPMPWSVSDLEEATRKLIEANHRTDGSMRITVSRGENLAGPDAPETPGPTLLITTATLRPVLDRPMRMVTVSLRRDPGWVLNDIKSLNYLPNILARFEVKEKNADEGMMLNTQGHIAEGTVSNLFWIKERALFTPSRDCGLLPGIARSTVLDMAPEVGLRIEEGAFGPSAPHACQAMFATNSLVELTPVVELDGTPLDVSAADIVRELRDLYRERVNQECGIHLP